MKLYIFTVLLLLSLCLEAAEWQSTCSKAERVAATIMKKRQQGVSLSDMMKIAKNNKIAETIMIDAYEVPEFSSQQYIGRAIREFSAKWYLECVKTAGKR